MYEGRRDYLRRRDERRRRKDMHHTPMGTQHYGEGMHTYSPDHARRRYDAAMDRARRRRGRKINKTSGYDSSYGVGHYIYNDPSNSEYVPVIDQYGQDYSDHDKEYEHDLHEWAERMKQHDRFKLRKEDMVKYAKEMQIEFHEFTEDELYAVYLMHTKLYPDVSKEPRVYIKMAKDWLCEHDIAVDPCEKICKYLYEIVLDD